NPATVPAATISLIDRALTDLETQGYSNSKTKSYAAFGQVDWQISDPLTLTVGLRYTHEDKEGEFRRYLASDSGGDRSLLTPAQQAAYQVNDLAYTAAVKADAVSGLATLAYKVAPDVLLYGSYARGNKSGGLNITAGGINRPVVDPEKVNAFELGLKSQFLDGKATFNAAAFLTEIKDYQANVTEQVPGTTQTVQYIASIPKVRSKGIEADLNIALSEWVNLGGSVAYTDAKFVSFTNSPQAPERSNEGAIQDLSGRRLPGVPKFAYSANLDVAQPLGENLEIYSRADWNYRSSYNGTPTLSAYGRIPAYGLLNARLGIRTADGQLDLSFWARNLLDKQYYVNRSANTFGLLTGTPGDPRTAGATLRVKW
ncbi:MAG: TonB-dependent receptor, partial [Hyphomicrobiales bacterium]